MYFCIVRQADTKAQLEQFSRIRSAPHSRLSLAISLIKATVSGEIFGLESAALDLYFQYSLNP